MAFGKRRKGEDQKILPFMRIGCAAVIAILAASCSGSEQQGNRDRSRSIVTETWDTVLLVGSVDPNDTTLLIPTKLALWQGRIAVLDVSNQVIRVLAEDGDIRWSYSTRGAGPGEIQNVNEFGVGPDQLLWLKDADNGKILALDKSGRLRWEKPLYHLPVAPRTMLLDGDTIVFTSQSPNHGVMSVHAKSLGLIRSDPYPWPDPLSADYNLVMNTAGSYHAGWVGAFQYGPGFLIARHERSTVHEYIDHIPWALKSAPHIRAMGLDSARYGARALSIAGEEIYMLFGGRPYRAAHAEEPTRYIDVYGMDGAYRRSYLLPSDSWEMSTEDGETFYVLTMSEHGNPLLLGLRPREGT